MVKIERRETEKTKAAVEALEEAKRTKRWLIRDNKEYYSDLIQYI